MTDTLPIEEHDGSIGPLDDVDAHDALSPGEKLAQLKAKVAPGTATERPLRVNLKDLHEYPEVFQPRGHDVVEFHVQALIKAIRTHGRLDPIKVVQIGNETVVIDGHHRRAAYAEAGVLTDIPVVFFDGTLEEAVLEAGRANSQAKLQMDNRERQDFGWRLVRMGYKKKDIVAAATVSDGQVGIMRRVLKQLGETADDHPVWFRALKAAQGMGLTEMTDAEREAWVDGQSQDFADRMSKEFGSKLTDNIEIAAGALAIYFGRRLPELVSDLAAYVPSDDDDGTSGDF